MKLDNWLMGHDDLLPHLEDSIRSGEFEDMTSKLTVSVQVINIQCPCGGSCVSIEGSFMIDASSSVVTCEMCGTDYFVPQGMFRVVKKSVAEPIIPDDQLQEVPVKMNLCSN
jgi:hypothetical protein